VIHEILPHADRHGADVQWMQVLAELRALAFSKRISSLIANTWVTAKPCSAISVSRKLRWIARSRAF
jgi:hypothetical protein